jgi:hypothetical protein
MTNFCFSSCSLATRDSPPYYMPCQFHHMFCMKCLQTAANEYIASNRSPVCHSALCDYQLSFYDVIHLPLEADIVEQLCKCVQSTRRPQCPNCLFYVEFKSKDDLVRHVDKCNIVNQVTCQYCYRPYNMYALNAHERECSQTLDHERRQVLIEFILPRTKYSMTSMEVFVFIEHQKTNHRSLDARSIIDTLAELG